MPIFDIDPTEAEEMVVLSESEEHLVQVGQSIGDVKTSQSEGRNGQQYLVVRFLPVNAPTAHMITHLFWLPHPNCDERDNNSRLLELQHFGEAFGLDMTPPINTDDWIGKQGWVGVRVEETSEGDRNRVVRWCGRR